ncbi:MAG: hypothetical protein M1823_004652 [Watsoniomyces obsoletus]|nr:MAG: hypothetical protein M1823_004652 [Watsoniomyces obsoletus]
MASTTATATPVRQPFERRVEEVKVSKREINGVVMEYLVHEGFPSSAKQFAIEAGMEPKEDIESIRVRVEIRTAIYQGDIQNAITKINEVGYQILDQNPSLHFALLRLQLVELIRPCMASPNGDIAPALTFAQTVLAPRAPSNPEFLEDLEQTMALLIFPPEDLARPLAGLLDPELRKSVAERVNTALLKNEGARREARLRKLFALRAWVEKRLREAKKDLPDKLSLGLDLEEEEEQDGTTNGAHDVEMQDNGHLEGEDTL